MSRVGAELMGLCARALRLDAGFFDDKLDRAISMLRALWYPDQPRSFHCRGSLRAGVHTDYGSLTLISAEDRPGGLQVLDRGGEWAGRAGHPGALMVNIGDLLAEWTAEAWPSTLHRVVNPPRDQAMDSSRLAFAFYHHPNYDARIDPLPGLGAPVVGQETMTAGRSAGEVPAPDHLRRQLRLIRSAASGHRRGDLQVVDPEYVAFGGRRARTATPRSRCRPVP